MVIRIGKFSEFFWQALKSENIFNPQKQLAMSLFVDFLEGLDKIKPQTARKFYHRLDN